MGRKRILFFTIVIQTIFILVCFLVGMRVIPNTNTRTHEIADARFHDIFMRVRNAIATPPKTEELVLVGIDDVTIEHLGQYGRRDWRTRTPFLKLLDSFQKTNPRVAAFDILFFDEQGDMNENLLDDAINQDLEMETKLQSFISQFLEQDGEFSNPMSHLQTIRMLGSLTSEVGEAAMGVSLAQLYDTSTFVLMAYSIPKNITPLKWTQEDILGDDPDFLDEESGLTVPYLLDTQIPPELIEGDMSSFFFNPSRAYLPSNEFLDYCHIGFINAPRDIDGVVRRLPLVRGLRYSYINPTDGKKIERKIMLPSIALNACLAYYGINLIDLQEMSPKELTNAPLRIVMGDAIYLRKAGNADYTRIPIDEKGNMVLDYHGRISHYNQMSLLHAFDHEIAKLNLNNKLAMVGMTATGNVDMGPTPVSELSPFVLVHLTAIANIINETFIYELTHTNKLMWCLLIWFFFICGTVWLSNRNLAGISVLFFIFYPIYSYLGIHNHWVLFPIVLPMTIALVCFFCALFMFYVTEQREKNKMRGMFSRMVSPEVLSYMDQDPDKFALTGVNREATMFFSDVAGFTTISENLTPEQLVGLLNDYLTPMSDIVVETHGYLDKYEGDAIMAVWGVPYPDDEHAIQGCKAAILQQKKLDEIRPLLKEKYGVELTARMGINSGEVSAGNMGSEQKMQYTVMGDPVNQAARYEPLNKMYDTDIIIGQSTFEQAEKHINARLLDKMVVKGKTIPIKVYELLAFEEEISTDKQFAVDQYEKALALHWERKFDEALAILQETFDREILDIPSQRLYERIKGFKEHPPVEGWQGEVFRTSKD